MALLPRSSGLCPLYFRASGLVDALFESVSGFSATGATILVESNAQGYYIVNSTLVNNSICTALMNGLTGDLAGYNIAFQAMNSQTFYGLLFWRSFQQLIGGLGIILMVVAIFPQLRVAGRQLYRAETVGPSKDTITPRATATARILWKVYLLFNALEIVLLDRSRHAYLRCGLHSFLDPGHRRLLSPGIQPRSLPQPPHRGNSRRLHHPGHVQLHPALQGADLRSAGLVQRRRVSGS